MEWFPFLSLHTWDTRERKAKIKPVLSNASLKERITLVFPPFPVGFITVPAVATAAPPLGCSPSWILDLRGVFQQIERFKSEWERGIEFGDLLPISYTEKKPRVFFSNPLRKHVFFPREPGPSEDGVGACTRACMCVSVCVVYHLSFSQRQCLPL